MAVTLAVPTVVVVGIIILLSLPHLTLTHLQPPEPSFEKNWVHFVGVILALSGVEAIANLTGVMKLDPGATMELPVVRKTATRSILVVAVEVVIGTAILGWAMLSLSPSLKGTLEARYDDMLTVLAEQYGTMTLGPVFGKVFGILTALVVGLLLLSAVNTAVVALIGLLYLLARDGEMPKGFAKLNPHGVPWVPVIVATALPLVVVSTAAGSAQGQEHLMDLYAIGVVGAITVNLGSCIFNKRLGLKWNERGVMIFTALILLCVEMTLAKTKPNALYFIVCILLVGFGLRAIAQRKPEAVEREPAPATELPMATAPTQATFTQTPVQAIMVAARGWTRVLDFALDEAKMRGAILYVLYVRVVAVSMPSPAARPAPARWQTDPPAAEIMNGMLALGGKAGARVLPVYAVSDDIAGSILDLSATLGIDMLVLGAPQRSGLTALLRGDVVTEVAKHLPDTIQLVIHG
jgi:amino acid transporter/nucleotide-binding universal stress UspA family protein